MLRFALFGFLALAFASHAAADDKKDAPKELAPFQGEWKVVSATFAGRPAPKGLDEVRFTFDGDKVTVKEPGDKAEAGTYKIDPKATPATIDLSGPKGEPAAGIYKFDKDGKLTLAFVKGKDQTRPKGFDDKDAVVMVLEKVKK